MKWLWWRLASNSSILETCLADFIDIVLLIADVVKQFERSDLYKGCLWWQRFIKVMFLLLQKPSGLRISCIFCAFYHLGEWLFIGAITWLMKRWLMKWSFMDIQHLHVNCYGIREINLPGMCCCSVKSISCFHNFYCSGSNGLACLGTGSVALPPLLSRGSF